METKQQLQQGERRENRGSISWAIIKMGGRGDSVELMDRERKGRERVGGRKVVGRLGREAGRKVRMKRRMGITVLVGVVVGRVGRGLILAG